MRRFIKGFLLAVGAIFIIIILITLSRAEKIKEVSLPATTPSQNVPIEASAQDKLIISNYNYDASTKYVVGEVTNKDSIVHTLTLKATFYDVNNKIVGTADGAISDLSPNETKIFNLYSTATIPEYKTLKVQIDSYL